MVPQECVEKWISKCAIAHHSARFTRREMTARSEIGYFLHCSNGFPPPLLTSNGLSAGFSVFVRQATKSSWKGAVSAFRTDLTGGLMNRLILAASVAALALIGPAAAQSPIVIKFSHVVASDTPKGKAAEKFKELAEKYTNGKVKVEVYPNSTLYKDKEEIEALQLGSVQMLAPSTAKFAPLGAKEFEALDLPWLFKDDATYSAAMKGQVGKWLFQKLEAKGISGLAYWDNGFHMMSANRPLLK